MSVSEPANRRGRRCLSPPRAAPSRRRRSPRRSRRPASGSGAASAQIRRLTTPVEWLRRLDVPGRRHQFPLGRQRRDAGGGQLRDPRRGATRPGTDHRRDQLGRWRSSPGSRHRWHVGCSLDGLRQYQHRCHDSRRPRTAGTPARPGRPARRAPRAVHASAATSQGGPLVPVASNTASPVARRPIPAFRSPRADSSARPSEVRRTSRRIPSRRVLLSRRLP